MDAGALTKLVNDVAAFALSQYAEKAKSDEFRHDGRMFVADDYIQSDSRETPKNLPSSVVKLFYLVAAQRWLETENRRQRGTIGAMKDMIVDSSNDRHHYVTRCDYRHTSGLSYRLPKWLNGRKSAMSLTITSVRKIMRDINVNQKPWGDGPYGRESVFAGENRHNRICSRRTPPRA